MGAGVSDWRLARAVASRGQIGVVSGTALDLILTRRLQMGDPDGSVRRALGAFPDQAIADRIVDRYFIQGGKEVDRPFATKPITGHAGNRQLEELSVAANFVEVTLAKEGHDGLVGINYLHKIQAPLLPSLYGAILAGVDAVMVGAGIPLDIPDILDQLSRGEAAELKLNVRNAGKGRTHLVSFDPHHVLQDPPSNLQRPLFFPIVSSVTLAALMVKKCPGQIDGLVVEGPTAGGHNAPPRGKPELNSDGEPVYSPRDAVDLEGINALGLPFWLAGSHGHPEKLIEARASGATGVQVGTLFAFCEESGLRPDIKRYTIAESRSKAAKVFTDPIASPTGFPFKVLSLPDSLSSKETYSERGRQCDLGYLREPYERADGTLAWRCRAEDPAVYVRHGGEEAETIGRKCLCNSLMANIGLPQLRRDAYVERPLVTCGDDLSGIARVLNTSGSSYSASDAINYLLSGKPA